MRHDIKLMVHTSTHILQILDTNDHSGDVRSPDVDRHSIALCLLLVEVQLVILLDILMLLLVQFHLLLESLLDSILHHKQTYIHVLVELLILPQQLDEVGCKGLHLLLSELEDDHVTNHDQHLVEDSCSFTFEEFLLAMEVAWVREEIPLEPTMMALMVFFFSR